MLKLHFKDHSQPPIWVVEKTYSIGTATNNQLVIADASVDATHARLVREDDKFFLKDNNSASGSFVNGQRITQREILPGDILRFGATEIIVLDPRSTPEKGKEEFQPPWRLISDSNWLPGKQFVIFAEKNLVIGRSNQCDIIIPGTHLSRKHAEISIEGNHLRIKDLGSANGTFLNELQISNATANNGDKLRIDVYSFRIVAPDNDAHKTRVRKSIGDIAKPVERKQPSQEPKRWKTRPTSPGNRMEPTYRESHSSLKLALGATLLMAGIVTGIYLWF